MKPVFFSAMYKGYNSIYNDHRASLCKNDGRKNGLVLCISIMICLSWGDTDTPDTPDTIHTCPGKILESERHT